VSLKSEGLGRYYTRLIKAFLAENHQVALAAPKWAEGLLKELFQEYGVDIEKCELITTRAVPFSLRLDNWRLPKKPKRQSKLLDSFKNKLRGCLDFIADTLLTVRSWEKALVLILFSIIIGLLALPFIAAGLALAGILRLAKNNRMSKFAFETIKNGLRHGFEYLINRRDIKEIIRQNAAKELLLKISRMKEPADVWFAPTAFWLEFNKIKGVRVNCIPDLVTDEFALNYISLSNDPKATIKTTETISKCIETGSYFITYCNYIKHAILIDKFGKSEASIKPIMTLVNETLPYIDVKKAFPYYDGDANLFYATMYSFWRESYIFYASQDRPHKNILNLIKAYHYLLKKDLTVCKLVLTADLAWGDAARYIHDNGLEEEVLQLCNLPNRSLAAFYAKADLVVNPTLYEGGFPFTFSEGMSVGTPSVMGRIPQIMEFVAGHDLEDCLFDPYDYRDIADKILYGLKNRELLAEKQRKLYEIHLERTRSGQAIREYIEAFEYFINLSKNREQENA
jgi:glycosyltransferase involved in cell wall biosynthesis